MARMRKSILLVLSFGIATLVAQAAPEAPAPCRYQPGTSFTAEIQISVSDHEVPADSATVKLHTRIPPNGRTAQAGPKGHPRYIAALDPVPVHLAKDTLKYFSLAPSVIIEAPDSADCHIKMEMGIGSRNWARQSETNYTIKAELIVGGQHTTVEDSGSASCLDQDTLILLADGSRVPIKLLVPGDVIRNPVTSASAAVEEVIHGAQADDEMYRIGFGSSIVSFTAWHPLMTKLGLKPARYVELGDFVLGEDGVYHCVTVRQPFTGDPARLVFNLRLTAASDTGTDHLMSVGGLVTGDFFLQNSLQSKAETPRK
jgi:hypothetical protein